MSANKRDRKMKMGNLERMGKRKMKDEARNNLKTEKRARKQHKQGMARAHRRSGT